MEEILLFILWFCGLAIYGLVIYIHTLLNRIDKLEKELNEKI